MKLLTKTFITPLLALAFKEGVDFVSDPDYRALEPKQLGPTEWEVAIEWDNDDDDIVQDPPGAGWTPKKKIKVIKEPVPEKKQTTLKDYEARFSKMKPITAQSAPGQEREVANRLPTEIVHLPVKPKKLKLCNDGSIITGEDPGPLVHMSSPFEHVDREFPTVDDIESTFSPPPIVSPIEIPDTESCGKCLPCSQGGDCIEMINAACQAMIGASKLARLER